MRHARGVYSVRHVWVVRCVYSVRRMWAVRCLREGRLALGGYIKGGRPHEVGGVARDGAAVDRREQPDVGEQRGDRGGAHQGGLPRHVRCGQQPNTCAR